MKIYGKESDYYDSALAYGQDPLCKWTRKFTKYGTGLNDENPLPDHFFGKEGYMLPRNQHVQGKLNRCFWFDRSHGRNRYTFKTGYVFFCGKTYPFIKVEKNYSDNITIFYDYRKFNSFLDKELPGEVVDKCDATFRFQHRVSKRELSEWFGQELDCEDLHRVSGIPVYVVSVLEGLEEGGCLKDYQFAKVFDPYTCLQELDMYISGVLGGSSPKMITISDEDLLVGKGFDKKISFRKRKGG